MPVFAASEYSLWILDLLTLPPGLHAVATATPLALLAAVATGGAVFRPPTAQPPTAEGADN